MENLPIDLTPQQERSIKTMNKIMDAAAEILETKNFEQISINEIVEQAGVSVGAFYGRFKDKDGLLEALDERFFTCFEADILDLISAPGWAQMPVIKIIKGLCSLLVNTYSRQTGLLRSLNLKARLYDDQRFRKREQKAWNELFPRLQQALLLKCDEFKHPDPQVAIVFGFQQMFFTLREILLWEPLRSQRLYENEELINELTRAYLVYLGWEEGHS